ncbi:hypothetical protein V1522DRAFT_424803 [Lipomyces starkeyi]
MADNFAGLTYAAITALNEDERMVTRHKRPANPERLFNSATDQEVVDEKRHQQSLPPSQFGGYMALVTVMVLAHKVETSKRKVSAVTIDIKGVVGNVNRGAPLQTIQLYKTCIFPLQIMDLDVNE